MYDKLPAEDAATDNDADNEQAGARVGGRRGGKSKEKPAFKETAIENEVLGVDVTMHEQAEETASELEPMQTNETEETVEAAVEDVQASNAEE